MVEDLYEENTHFILEETHCLPIFQGKYGLSHLVKSHFVNIYHMGIDKVGIDQMGIDQMGIDQMGIDEVGIDKVGRYLLHTCWSNVSVTNRSGFKQHCSVWWRGIN